MELTHEEIERYIDQISSGSKIVDIDDEVILLKFPDRRDIMKARRIYDSEYKKSIDEGLLSMEDMKKIVESRNLLTDKDRRKLSSLESKLEAQKVLLAKTVKVKANQDRIKGIIHDLEDKIRVVKHKEHSKFSMTAETRAEESKVLYLCWCSTYDFDTEKLFWSIFDLFLNDRRITFRQKVISEFILFYGGINTSHIRATARSNLWRIRYVTSLKTSEPLFGVPASIYTNDMLNLAYWSHYYQNIYEMLPDDQPSEDIIEDDEANYLLIKLGLRRSGISNRIIRFADGNELLDFLYGRIESGDNIEKAYALILNIDTSEGNGLEVLTSIKQSGSLNGIPVIVTSSCDDHETISLCYSLGCVDYKVKPIKVNEIISAFESIGLIFSRNSQPAQQ